MKILPILACLLALFPEVSAQVAHRLEPQAPEGNKANGREYISLQNDSIRIEMGFDGVFEDFFVFDVVVTNQMAHPVSVDPAAFHYVILDSADAPASVLPPFRATPPERILERYTERIGHSRDHQEMNRVLGCIEGGINLLANASAFLATDDPYYIVDAVFSSVGTAGHYMSMDLAFSRDVELVRHEQEVVRSEIMRPAVLPAGKVVSGFVFFPVYDEPGYLMFCIPEDNQMFQFVYKQ